MTVHSLRVTALTTARERGSDIIDLQDFAGHADPRTTLTYIRSRDRLSKSPAYVLKYHVRDLELREQALDSGLQQIRAEQQKLADDKESYDRLRTAFDNQLKELNDGSQATGRENIRLIWENIKPKQAKEQILQMVQAGQQNDVVAIMSAMPISKRAKIIGEFKSEEESKKLQEILDLIRRGMPEQQVIENTQQQVTQNKP